MTDAEWWDARATTREDAMAACWSDDTWSEELEACYDAVASDLDPVLNPSEQPGSKMATALRHILKPQVLDLGCGVGRLTIPFAMRHRDLNVVGFDTSSLMLHHALGRSIDVGVDNIDWYFGSELGLPFRPFAAAWSMLVFQHLSAEQILIYLEQIRERLYARGRFRFQYVTGEGADPEARDYRRSPELMTEMCERRSLRVLSHDIGLVRPEWGWITAERPS